MQTSNSVARALGVFLLLHLVVGLTAPFIILHSITGSRGFLTTAVENAAQVRIAIFLLLLGSAMAIAVSCLPAAAIAADSASDSSIRSRSTLASCARR